MDDGAIPTFPLLPHPSRTRHTAVLRCFDGGKKWEVLSDIVNIARKQTAVAVSRRPFLLE
jgi:hypothetical protein